MKVKMANVIGGICAFYDKYIAPLGFGEWALSPFVPKIIDNYVKKNKSMLEYILDENDEIDLDDAYKIYSQKISEKGKIKVGKYSFDNNDLKNLLDAIKATV